VTLTTNIHGTTFGGGSSSGAGVQCLACYMRWGAVQTPIKPLKSYGNI